MRMKKSDHAYYEIRKRILKGGPAEYSGISESSLAAELHMSRTPVREALQQLQAEGFIEIRPNRGIVVPEVSIVEVNETFAFRMAIEEFVIREIASSITRDNLDTLDRLLALQEETVDREDMLDYLRYDKPFHEYFLRIYSNSMIFNTMQRVLDRFLFMGTNVLKGPGSVLRSYQQHCAVVDGLRRRDGEAAAAAMRLHMETGRNNVLSQRGCLNAVYEPSDSNKHWERERWT